jgi:hypothetical protein
MPEPKEGDYVSRADYDRLRADFDAMQAALEEQLSVVDERDARIAELEPFESQARETGAKLRGLTHQREYEKLADELKIRPEFRDDVWKLAGYEAKEDATEPDGKAIREHLGKFLETRGHYTGESSKGSSGQTKLPKGEGASHGAKNPGGDGKFRVTSKQLNDATFMERNQSKIAAASLEDNFEIVDE